MIFSKQKTGYRDAHKRFRKNFKTEIGQHLYKSIQTQLKLILETLIKPKEIRVMHKKIPFVNFVFYRYYYEREREIEIFRNSSLLSFTRSNSTFFHRKQFLSQQQICQMKNKARQIFANFVRVFLFVFFFWKKNHWNIGSLHRLEPPDYGISLIMFSLFYFQIRLQWRVWGDKAPLCQLSFFQNVQRTTLFKAV